MPKRTLFTVYIDDPRAAESFVDLFDRIEPLTLESTLTPFDVVFFDGGVDVDASIYGEAKHPFAQSPNRHRDEVEKTAFRRAQWATAGCLGICRGSQFLTVMSGGLLIQHVSGHGLRDGHFIMLKDGIWERDKVWVTSTHHQMMWPFDISNHELIGWSKGLAENYCEYGKKLKEDMEPEIVFYPDTRSLCIQGHPEYLTYHAEFPNLSRKLVKDYLFSRKGR